MSEICGQKSGWFGPIMRGRRLVAILLMVLSVGAVTAASASADGTIVAMKGGDRSASNNVSGAANYASPLAGALFEYASNAAGPWTDFPAVTSASGTASALVPAGTYYVREKTTPAGFDDYGPVTTLSFNGSQQYVARVTVSNNATTYAFPHTNNNANPANWTPTNVASATNNGSPFVNVRNNGVLPEGCGTNILLVLDRSGSIEPYKAQYEAAAKQFVSSLNGTPTQIGIISFNNTVNSYQPAQGNAGFYQSPLNLANGGSAGTLNGVIENIYANPQSLTNWDGVLQAAAQAKSFTADAATGQTTNPDMVVFITDGNPTTSQASTSSSNQDLIDLTSGIASANLVKNQAARPGGKVKLLAIGVGTGVTIDNLKVVSGPDEGVDGDYAAPTIPELSAFLSELAASQCGARVYVRKHVTGQNGNQAGWFYTATDPRPGKTPTYLDGNRATHSSGNPPVIETGAFFTQLPSTPTVVNIDEDAAGQPITNFELTSVDCRYGSYTGSAVPGGVKNGFQFSLPVNRGDTIFCTYTNSPKTTLNVAKTPDNQLVDAGEDVEFSITVTNTGTNSASGVTLSDVLPAPGVGGWSISQQPGGSPCVINAGTLNCAFGNLNPGGSVTVKVKTGTSFALCGVYDNTAQASAANASLVTDSGKVTCRKPNLQITKMGNGPINAGQNASYTITVKNDGPGEARAVTLSDPLPGGTAGPWVIGSQPAGNPCSVAGNSLSCSFGDLAAGQQVQVTVNAPTDDADCTTYDNTATASGSNHPQVQASASITCQKPALGTLKTAVQGTISAGDDARFEITVSNTGPGTATNVTLSDPLPNGVSGAWTIVEQPAGNPCSIVANTLTCTFGDMASGTSKVVKVTAPTDFENCTQLVNLATASASNSPDASDDATIQCDKPNLSVTKQGNGTIDAGEKVTFKITVANAGPGIARSVKLSDPLPSGTAGDWTITAQPGGNPCSITAGTLDCDFGDLAAGQSRVIDIEASTDAENCTGYDNTATATSTNAPQAQDEASVDCRKPGLTVSKTGSGTVNAGEDVEFTITVGNAGPGTATAVALSDPLPEGTAAAWQITSQPAGNPCSIVAGLLGCAFGDLDAGESVVVKVAAPTSFANCGVYDNTATMTAGNAPTATANDSVQCEKPDLTLEKEGNGTVDAGENVVFTLTMKNGGPGVAKSATLSDPLPAGVVGTWSITDQPVGNPCAIVAGQLDCDFGDLPAGASRSVTVSAATDFGHCTEYDNTATGSAGNHPQVADDASVECLAPNLKISKTGNGPVNAGEDLEYTITVKNDGPGTAKAVKLNDPLPTGAAGAWSVGSQPAGDPCAITLDELDCEFGDLGAGDSVEVKVKAPTSHDACRMFDNEATAIGANVPEVSAEDSIECLKPALGTLKTAVEGTISAGDKARFEITVTNTGPGTAKAVTLSDPLPTDVAGSWSIVSQPAGDPCSIAGGTLTCDFGDMAADDSKKVTVEALTDFERCEELPNLATASSTNSPDATDEATIDCNRPDLEVTKEGNGPVNAGEAAEFSIEVRNNGEGIARAVTLNDPLPQAGGAWSIVSQPQGDPCSIQAGTLSCEFGDLQPGSSVEVVVSAVTTYEACVTLDNVATADAGNSPPENGEASIACQRSDLTISKNGNGPVDAGEAIQFRVEVSNEGPGVAKAVVMTDTLPSGTAAPWLVVSASQGSCAIEAGTLTCEFGDIPAGGAASVTVSGATSAEACGTYDNTATFTAGNAPSGTAAASAQCLKPNLRISKTGNGPVNAGRTVRFTMTVTNDGPGEAKGVTLSDPLPNNTAGGWQVEVEPSPGACSVANRTLNCGFGDLAAGQSASVRVAAPTSDLKCARYDNTAETGAENALTVTGSAVVSCRKPDPKLQLRKFANKRRVFPGDIVRYRIQIRNLQRGSVARNLKVCDRLPAQMTVASRGKDTFFENGKLCWRISRLGFSRKWKTFTYTARVNDGVSAGTRLRNVVIMGNLRATRTVVVRQPEVSPARRRTPVTG